MKEKAGGQRISRQRGSGGWTVPQEELAGLASAESHTGSPLKLQAIGDAPAVQDGSPIPLAQYELDPAFGRAY